jgi:hypothetical protein
MPNTTPTPEELRSLLAVVIAGVAGGEDADWEAKVGPVQTLQIALHPRSNWAVSPTCTGEDLATINKAVDVVRNAFPYVR